MRNYICVSDYLKIDMKLALNIVNMKKWDREIEYMEQAG